MNFRKFKNFKEAIRTQTECRRVLHSVQLLQEAVYGKSYLDTGGENSILSTNTGDLGEWVAASYYGADVDRQSGHDILKKAGITIESKYRTMYADPKSSAYLASAEVITKNADKLFFLVYNPVREKLDAFEYQKGEYGKTVTVRWSTRDNEYKMGKTNRIDFPEPKELFRNQVMSTMESHDWQKLRKICRGYSADDIQNLIMKNM
jgi:hypothetical protein